MIETALTISGSVKARGKAPNSAVEMTAGKVVGVAVGLHGHLGGDLRDRQLVSWGRRCVKVHPLIGAE